MYSFAIFFVCMMHMLFFTALGMSYCCMNNLMQPTLKVLQEDITRCHVRSHLSPYVESSDGKPVKAKVKNLSPHSCFSK